MQLCCDLLATKQKMQSQRPQQGYGMVIEGLQSSRRAVAKAASVTVQFLNMRKNCAVTDLVVRRSTISCHLIADQLLIGVFLTHATLLRPVCDRSAI